tara:strand:- start:201 stop:650 length:450 start_codon:yes stop_codon:yes gene_type:complete
MAKENKIIIINNKAQKSFINKKKETEKVYTADFGNYKKIEKFLRENQTKSLEIYDITSPKLNNSELPVNDHINRIGHNPFIGNQKKYNIDFINVEHIYTQHPNGVTTNSCGNQQMIGLHPSTHLANIVILAHLLGYTISAYLIGAEKRI